MHDNQTVNLDYPCCLGKTCLQNWCMNRLFIAQVACWRHLRINSCEPFMPVQEIARAHLAWRAHLACCQVDLWPAIFLVMLQG